MLEPEGITKVFPIGAEISVLVMVRSAAASQSATKAAILKFTAALQTSAFGAVLPTTVAGVFAAKTGA